MINVMLSNLLIIMYYIDIIKKYKIYNSENLDKNM